MSIENHVQDFSERNLFSDLYSSSLDIDIFRGKRSKFWKNQTSQYPEIAPLCSILSLGNEYIEKMKLRPTSCGIPLSSTLDKYFGPIHDQKAGAFLKDLTAAWMGKACELGNLSENPHKENIGNDDFCPYTFFDNTVCQAGYLVVSNIDKSWGMLGDMYGKMICEANFDKVLAQSVNSPEKLFLSLAQKPEQKSQPNKIVSVFIRQPMPSINY